MISVLAVGISFRYLKLRSVELSAQVAQKIIRLRSTIVKYAEVREKIRTFKSVRFVAAQVVGRGRPVPTAR